MQKNDQPTKLFCILLLPFASRKFRKKKEEKKNNKRKEQKNEKILIITILKERTKVKFPEHKIEAQGNRIGENKERIQKKFRRNSLNSHEIILLHKCYLRS